MEQLLLELKALYVKLFPFLNIQTLYSKHLCVIAYENLGKDLSPTQGEFGCAETISTVLQLAFGDTWHTLSTAEFYLHFLKSPYYVQVYVPLAGDILVSPTGYGNGKIPNGHIGIVGNTNAVLSNNSLNSLFDIHYTLDTWKARYVTLGGYPMYYFRRVSTP